MKNRCYICWTEEDEDNEVKHYPLFPVGSEGVWLCFTCQLAITHQIEEMARAAAKARKIAYKAMKQLKESQAKDSRLGDND